MRRICLRFVIALLSLVGVAAAHQLAFWLAATHNHDRQELLASTGHGLSWLPACIAVCAAVSLAATADKVTWRRLAAIQMVAFAFLEASERVLAHDDAGALLQEPVFYVGAALQVLIAIAGYLLARLLIDVARRFLARPLIARGSTPPSLSWATQNTPRLSLARVAWNLRGPPALRAIA